MAEYRRTEWDVVDEYQQVTASDAIDTAEQTVNYQEHYQPYPREERVAETPVAKKGLGFGKLLALVLVGALAAGSAFGFVFNMTGANEVSQATEPEKNGDYFIEAEQQPAERVAQLFNQKDVNSIPALYKQLAPNVVSITNKAEIEDFFYGKQSVEGSGTGVIFNINEDSVLIVTNHHVIDNADQLLVAFDGENTIQAQLIGSDEPTDIAVIKVNKKDIPSEILAGLNAVVLGDSDKAQVGEMVVAIGNPLGYDDTLTVGFVSGINRKLDTSSGRQIGLLQTDASINPGNSGGALVNMRGELIGINSIKITNTGGRNSVFGGGVSVDNMGFAIPVNVVKEVVDEILTKGYVSKPYMGIAGKTVTKEIAKEYNLSEGIFVSEVQAHSGAADAGLKYGDIITDVDAKGIKTINDLVNYLYDKKIGDKIKVKVDRKGKILEFDVELKEKVVTPDGK